jgi:hypothetical protein
MNQATTKIRTFEFEFLHLDLFGASVLGFGI